MIRLWRTVALALTAVAAPLTAQSRGVSTPDLAAFDRYVSQAVRDWKVTGLAIAIVKNDSLVFSKGYGVRDTRQSTPVDQHTRFAIGSTTKAMTSAAVAMLVDEGKLKWDDRVIDLLPEFRLYDPYATRETTVRDLVTHRTGLPGTDIMWGRAPFTMSEMIRRLRYVPPATSFRSTFEYQNVIYAVAGTIVERVSGMSWDAFIRSRIFAPLGMTESEPLVAGVERKPNVAVPHVLAGDSVRVVPYRTTDPIASAGSVYSSVFDMSKWMRFVLDSGRVGNKRLLSPATFSEWVTPQIRVPLTMYPALTLSRPHSFMYALGWFVQDYQGETIWMHTGSIDGMSAIIGLMPDHRMGVYVLANLDHAELRHALMYKAFDLYAGNPPRDWSADLRALFSSAQRPVASAQSAPLVRGPPSLPLERYAGTYVDSAYGTIAVAFTNGALRATFRDADSWDLSPFQFETFRGRAADGNQVSLTFVPDGAGNVTAVRALGGTFRRSR
jgi:CubicO group peptidase (beta-lactamase class C family)